MTAEFAHTPVLLTEILAALRPDPGGRFIDATVGGGGHAEKVLELTSPSGVLLGIDADPAAIAAATRRLQPFGDRAQLVESYFDRIGTIARDRDFSNANGVLFDLGVSSPQLGTASRGFSFINEAPLDMRFGPGATTSAADLVQKLPAAELERVFREYGEERFARRIARLIVDERVRSPIRTTNQLASIVTRANPAHNRERIHPATRVFQALRIAVNDELGRLEKALPQAVDVLRSGGRLAVVSFHSLEDRIVKQFLRRESRDCICPPEVPSCVCGHERTLQIITSRPIVASRKEIEINPRARSAKLRVAERTPS